MTTFEIRPAEPPDVPTLHAMICELAEFERLSHAVTATSDDLRQAMFGPRPVCEAIVAWQGIADVACEAVGFALFFHNYSTFVGRPGLYLEDLYVRPSARNSGVGSALFAHLVRIAVERGCGRMEWAALDWNESAHRFYFRRGAERLDDWRIFRLSGDALRRASEP